MVIIAVPGLSSGEKVNVEALRALRVIDCKSVQPWNKANARKKRSAGTMDDAVPSTQQESEVNYEPLAPATKKVPKKRQTKRDMLGQVNKPKKKAVKKRRTGVQIDPAQRISNQTVRLY